MKTKIELSSETTIIVSCTQEKFPEKSSMGIKTTAKILEGGLKPPSCQIIERSSAFAILFIQGKNYRKEKRMNNYYIRGPIENLPFFLVARVGNVPYYCTYDSLADRRVFIFSRNINLLDIVIFSAEADVSGAYFSGNVRDQYFYLGGGNYPEPNSPFVAVPSQEREVFIPVNSSIRNFGILLTGVPYVFLSPKQNNHVLTWLLRRTERSQLENITQVFAVPLSPYFGGTNVQVPSLAEMINLEESWGNSTISPLYTTLEDSLQKVPYYYCRDSLCAPTCKGACSLSNETCLVSPEIGFSCLTEEPPSLPYYRQAWFYGLAIALAFVFILSIILLIFIWIYSNSKNKNSNLPS